MPVKIRATRRLTSSTHQRSPPGPPTSGSTYAWSSTTARDSIGCASRTTSSTSAGPQANTATARVPFVATSEASSTSRTRSTSARSAIRSSWPRPSASSTLWAAAVSTELISVARAGGVANSLGSRLKKTERTLPRSGCNAASRRRRPRVIVVAAIDLGYPWPSASERADVMTRTCAPPGAGCLPGDDPEPLEQDEEGPRERRLARSRRARAASRSARAGRGRSPAAPRSAARAR